jgi:ABC-type Na+ transport system ATPase subunit NatA
MAVHIEHVQREYTENELLDFGKESARLIGEVAELEDQKKQATDHFKNEIGLRDVQVTEFSKKINMGYEIVPTPCDIVLNEPTPGMKSLICQKSLKVIKILPMSDDDKQLGLYGST